VIEGAGSPAELNLRDGDIVNMPVALHARSPVLLAGDIDRGGVMASLYGTVSLLPDQERRLIKGLIINRFRGDLSIVHPLPEMITQRTGVPVIEIVPYLHDLQVQEEDAAALERLGQDGASAECALIAAAIYPPSVSNFDDIDPLARMEGARVRVARRPRDLSDAHLIVLPGSESTISDLRSRGLIEATLAASRRGAAVVGICGGYQMLGEHLDALGGLDCEHPDSETGLGLLLLRTEFEATKRTARVAFMLRPGPGLLAGEEAVNGDGYEIHTGRTSSEAGRGDATAPVQVEGPGSARASRESSSDGWVLGTYVHGFFDSTQVRRRITGNIAARNGLPTPVDRDFSMEEEFGRLASAVRGALDMGFVYSLIDGS